MRIPKTCLSRLIIWMVLLLPVACGGGGGGTTAPPAVVAPSNLAYSTNPASYTKGIAITANTPSNGGGAVLSYAVQPGLPAGLNLSSASGAITGTPVAVTPTASYTITATNSGGSAVANLVITVHDTTPSGLTYSANPATYIVGTAIPPNTPSSTGGAIASYSVAPTLPAGLSLNGTSGVISGTPTAVTPTATYLITATNSGGTTTANLVLTVNAPAPHILSFSVGPDESPTYPNSPTDNPHLANLPDEHTTFIPLGGGPNNYLVFAASKLSGTGTTGGAVVLQTSDLTNFTWATSLGYSRQVFTPPVPIDQCNPTYQTEFDGNYAAPGSVVQDPTLPPGNLMIFYEAENHCPGDVNQQPFYATVGFARSGDNGKTWPAPVNSVLGDATRHPVLKGANPQPAVGGYSLMGDAIPSAFVDRNSQGDYYVYVCYGYHDGGMAPATDRMIKVGRAKLGTDPLTFQKWYNGAFSQPGIGGLDNGVTPGPGCPSGNQFMAEISYNDDLGVYMLFYVCVSGPTGARIGAWYYATATSLDLQNWSAPQMIQGSQFPVTYPCPGLTSGGQFDGWYPSLVSPGAAAGHTKLTGKIFFMNGCDTGARTFTSRTFTITVGP